VSATEAAVLVAVAGVVLAAGMWTAPRRYPTVDECWELLVVRRVAAGRRLYRDVFFGAGPLSVWAMRGVVALAGERLVAMRRLAVVVTVATAGVLVAWCVLLGVPLPAATAAAAGAALLSSALWRHDNLYGLMGRLGAALALTGPLLAARAAGPLDVVCWLVAGAGLAAALLSKYTLGIATLPGLVAGAAASAFPVAAVVVVVVVGALLAGLGYARIVVRSGWRSVLSRLVVNKQSFAESGRAGFLASWRAMHGVPPEGSAMEWRVTSGAFGLTALGVLLVAAGLVAGIGWSAGDPDTVAGLAGMTLVAVAALWPRADDTHVRNALLLWVPPAMVAAHTVLAPWLAAGLAAATLLAGLVALAVALVEQSRADVPPPLGTAFDGTVHGQWDPAQLQDGADELGRYTGGNVFLLRGDAAVWYLLTGLRNPTAYDYPLASTFGPHGQARVVAGLDSGRIRFCCFLAARAGPMTPQELEQYVAGLRVVAVTAAGTLVTAR
jgi:hypothetical protein